MLSKGESMDSSTGPPYANDEVSNYSSTSINFNVLRNDKYPVGLI